MVKDSKLCVGDLGKANVVTNKKKEEVQLYKKG